jgi:hypothetical protein
MLAWRMPVTGGILLIVLGIPVSLAVKLWSTRTQSGSWSRLRC